MCLTKNAKAVSEINPFLKQLFYSLEQVFILLEEKHSANVHTNTLFEW